MIKRTLHFGNPAFLHLENAQLMVKRMEEGIEKKRSVPIEDIGVVILDHPQISITHGAMAALLENNCAVITSNAKYMPSGLLLPLDGHSLQNERFRAQLDASEPLKKQLWQQTVQMKIRNQATVLESTGQDATPLRVWANEVKSGDTENHEARAAAWYWARLFRITGFTRERGGQSPNNYLNYGYAILRAVVARSLVGSGLLPTLGIHHANKYNAYCLADDIMEPYRPFVDRIVVNMWEEYGPSDDLDIELKKPLLQIPAIDVQLDKEKSPLLVASMRTTASLARCFEGTQRKILYPEL
ncbi:MAG TPA: type II CRISPR-associated endonuclease Cas1 [Anaerolineae bacterium]|nr:type II CRISPR-associated endonuclease Cas1 [Anaerolineae bacterium]HRE74636.1 type II CRISPR-associated endonuclease Cas1 [Flavobacteriales bacterium]HRJ38799.1 type II CRISPR-associated endonuclease Cas1 [Flavobacteriales bacterium]